MRFGAEINGKEGLLESNLALGNALVEVYDKCGANRRKKSHKLPAQRCSLHGLH